MKKKKTRYFSNTNTFSISNTVASTVKLAIRSTIILKFWGTIFAKKTQQAPPLLPIIYSSHLLWHLKTQQAKPLLVISRVLTQSRQYTNRFVWGLSDLTWGLSSVIEHCKLICKPWQSQANRRWVTLPHIQPWPIPLTLLPLLSLAHCQGWPVTWAVSGVGKLFGSRIPDQAHTDERNHLTHTLQSTTNEVEEPTWIRISPFIRKKKVL